MLGVNETSDPASLLNLSHHVQGHGGLTAGLRAVDFYNPSLGDAAKPQGDIQAQGTCGHCLNIHILARIPKLHHRPLAIGLLNLCNSAFQCL